MSQTQKVRTALVGVIVAAATSVAACSTATSAGSTASVLRYGHVGTVSCLDVDTCQTAEYVADQALEPLQEIGPDNKVHPWLAESVTQPDPATYVYHLRHGVRFWDGAPLTSADVVASLAVHQAKESYAFASVQSITATDANTVTIVLKHPDAAWPYQVANFALTIFEKNFYDSHKDSFGKPGTLLMGTGPYIPTKLDPTTGAELKANPNYWHGKVPIGHLSVKFFADETSAALAFRSGAVDIVMPNSPAAFEAQAATKLVSVPDCGLNAFIMNTAKAPWNDIHVRRAAAYALDPVEIAKANGGFTHLDHTLVTRSQLETLGTAAQVTSALATVPTYPFDVAKAKQEMAASAYPQGFQMELPTYDSGRLLQVNQVIAAELKQIGIDAQVKNIGETAYLAMLVSGPDGRQTSDGVAGCASPDPSNYNWLLGTANAAKGLYNSASWAPPDVDPLITQSVQTVDPAKRLDIYGQLLRRIGQDVPYDVLFTQDATVAIAGRFGWSTFDGRYFNRPWVFEVQPRS